jgi:hypothetical protein
MKSARAAPTASASPVSLTNQVFPETSVSPAITRFADDPAPLENS